jgi:hypothetical protein
MLCIQMVLRAHRIRPALGSFQHLKPFLVV